MKTKAIIMQPWGVRAILDGRKTQTRRVVKPQPPPCNGTGRMHFIVCSTSRADEGRFEFRHADPEGNVFAVRRETKLWSARCPYGAPGDLLWLRETWATPTRSDEPVYRADDDTTPGICWRPSIFMPRWASRLTLRITNVRVERVQEITYGACIAEGLDMSDVDYQPGWDVSKWVDIWDSINAKRGYSWESNPWVWVVEFEPIHENVDRVMEREAS